jgi:hypothetical protein
MLTTLQTIVITTLQTCANHTSNGQTSSKIATHTSNISATYTPIKSIRPITSHSASLLSTFDASRKLPKFYRCAIQNYRMLLSPACWLSSACRNGRPEHDQRPLARKTASTTTAFRRSTCSASTKRRRRCSEVRRRTLTRNGAT